MWLPMRYHVDVTCGVAGKLCVMRKSQDCDEVRLMALGCG
jgi:hypothetical protein